MRTRIILFLALALTAAPLVLAQQPVQTTQLQLQLADPPQPVPSGSAQLVGNPGPGTYFYWIVSKYTIGNSSPAGPFIVFNAPNALSASAYIQISWQPPAASLTYDVLRTTTAASPTGACACAVATAVSGTSTNDQSNSLGAYTVNTFDPSALVMTQSNESTAAGISELTIRSYLTKRFGIRSDGALRINGVLYTYPSAQGLVNQTLVNDGSGNLSWANAGGGAGNPSLPLTSVQFNTAGSFAGDATFTFNTVTKAVTAQSFLGNLTGNVTGNTSGSAGSFTGSLVGDVTGTQGATVVSTVGTSSAANVHAAELLANAATNANTVSRIVKRDGSGSFAAGVITATEYDSDSANIASNGTIRLNKLDFIGFRNEANTGNVNLSKDTSDRIAATGGFAGNLTGNVTGNVSGSAGSFTGSLVGDVTGTQGATVVSTVGTSSATNVHAAELLANAATNANTINAIVKRDGSGNFSAGTITGNLTGNASGTAANVTGTVAVANGGTGATSLTAFAPLFGGTTSTGVVQSGTAGTAGQVLTSNGAGVLPTFQAAPGGTIPTGTGVFTLTGGVADPAATATSGTGNIARVASPTFTGTANFNNLTAAGTLIAAQGAFQSGVVGCIGLYEPLSTGAMAVRDCAPATITSTYTKTWPSTLAAGAISIDGTGQVAFGTLAVGNGGTGITSLTSNFFPKGAGSGAFSASLLSDTGSALAYTGASGVAAAAFKSSTANPASAGAVQLAKTDAINFRNNANSADVNGLSLDASDVVNIGGSAGVKLGTGNSLSCVEGSAPSGIALSDVLYCDSTAHRLKMINNNGTAAQIIASGVDVNTSDQVTATHLAAALPVNQGGTGAATLTANNVILGNGTSAVQVVAPGTSGNVLTSNGSTWASAPAAAGGGFAMTTTGQGWCAFPQGCGIAPHGDGMAAFSTLATANQPFLYPVIIPYGMKTPSIEMGIECIGGSGCTATGSDTLTVALYDTSFNKVANTNATVNGITAGSNMVNIAITPVTVAAGMYFLGIASSNTTLRLPLIGTSFDSASKFLQLSSGNNLVVTCSNSASGAGAAYALPATCGTPTQVYPPSGLPLVVWRN